MALVDQIHALARKCAQMDKELAEMLAQVNVESLEKPYTAYIPNYSDIDISKIQDGAIVQTDEEIGEPEAVLADIEHSISGSRESVPSSYAAQQALANLANEIQGKVALDGSNTASIGSTLSTYMAHSAMPSDQYIDLTLPATNGGSITIPADGYLRMTSTSTSAGQAITFETDGVAITSRSYSSGNKQHITIAVSKDQIVFVYWAGTVNTFRFVYANGSAPTVNP